MHFKICKLNIDDGHLLVGEESNHYAEGEEVAWELKAPPPQIFGQMLCREGFVLLVKYGDCVMIYMLAKSVNLDTIWIARQSAWAGIPWIPAQPRSKVKARARARGNLWSVQIPTLSLIYICEILH